LIGSGNTSFRILQALVVAIFFQSSSFGQALSCPDLNVPSDGATDVPVNTNLEWNGVSGASSYTIRIGTTSGGTDIISDRNLGNVTMLNLEADLPPLSDIYISIFPSDTSGTNMSCSEFHFTTGITPVPRCTEIINPRDGDLLVPVNNNITWIRDFTATGYLMTIREGDPDGVFILDNEPVGNGTNYKPPNFKPRTPYYVMITPFNGTGPAENCETIVFTTGDPLPLPDCAEVTFPLNGASNVATDSNIRWNAVAGAEGYLLSIGTTPNGVDLVDNHDVGTDTSFNPTDDFPIGAQIYVKVVSYENGEMSESCPLFSFFTIGPENSLSQDFIPKFFTPNGDSINDEWRINPPDDISILQISVFNRFGLLLKQMRPDQAWDGTLNGQQLPSGSYWYSVQVDNARQIRGYFALKR